jgi:hypothetical protein
MNYTFFAIACYILMRAFRQLFKEYQEKPWYKIVYKAIAAITLYAALAGILVWYFNLRLLGFDFK